MDVVVSGAVKTTANVKAVLMLGTKPIMENEIIIEKDTRSIKLGDGSQIYADLPYFFNPREPITLDSSTTQSAISIVTPSGSGLSDTVPFFKIGTSDGLNGFGARWSSTTSNLDLTRTHNGVTSTALSVVKANGTVMLGNDVFRVLGNPSVKSSVRVIGATSNGSPVTIGSIPTDGINTDIPVQIQVLGNAYHRVISTNSTREIFRVNVINDANSNGYVLTPGGPGSPVIAAATGTSASVGLRMITTGTGNIELGGNYPGYEPVAVFQPRSTANVYLNVFGSGDDLTVMAYPKNLGDDATLVLSGVGLGGVKLTGNLGFHGTTPVGRGSVFGTYDGTITSLKDIVLALGSRLHETGLINWTVTEV